MRCKDDGLAGADQVTVVADDFGVGSADISNGIAIVWVTKDDGALDEGRLIGGQHRSGVVNELASLTANFLAVSHTVGLQKRTHE